MSVDKSGCVDAFRLLIKNERDTFHCGDEREEKKEKQSSNLAVWIVLQLLAQSFFSSSRLFNVEQGLFERKTIP